MGIATDTLAEWGCGTTHSLETTMQTVADRPETPSAIRNDLGAMFLSLALNRSTWPITSLSPGGGENAAEIDPR
jgi:hypothetical protein